MDALNYNSSGGGVVLSSHIKSTGLRSRSHYKLYLLLLITVITVSAVLYNNLSVIVLSFGWVLLSTGIIRLSFPKKRFGDSCRILFFFFFVYFLYMIVTNSLYVSDPNSDFFAKIDSLGFYDTIDGTLRRGLSLGDSVYYYKDWKGFGVLGWIVGWLGYQIDVNGIVVQKTQIVAIASLIVVFLYNCASIFLEQRKAMRLSIAYGLFTYLFTYSAIFTRDIHVEFVYMIGFYLLASRKRLLSIPVFGVLTFLAWTLRTVSGIFFLTFTCFYILLLLRSKGKLMTVFLGVVFMFSIIILGSTFLTTSYSELNGKVTHYDEYYNEKLEAGSGLANVVNKMPVLLQPPVRIVISQLSPFPFYSSVNSGNGVEGQYLLITEGISAIFWFYILGFAIYSFKIRRRFPIDLKFIFLISIILVLGAGGTSPEYRRLMCVYPGIFLVGAYGYYHFNVYWRKLILRNISFVYCSIYIFYFYLKLR